MIDEIHDQAIADVLVQSGFVTDAERAVARIALESAGLTRSGKTRISNAKVPRAREVLADGFAFGCVDCTSAIQAARPGALLLEVADTRCERCGGSDHRFAALRFLAACKSHGVRHVVVVGGSPVTRRAAADQLIGLELQLVDGTGPMNPARAKQLVHWADLVLIWGSTQLDHRVSRLFTSTADRKVVTAPRRGLRCLLDAGTTHLSRR